MALGEDRSLVTRHKDGVSWEIGSGAESEWMARGWNTVGLSITAAIPPVFESYATVVVPGEDGATDDHERRLIRLLTQNTDEQAWWLGYIDSGNADVIFPHAPRVRLYRDWPYVLVKAGPAQALRWRASSEVTIGHSHLPDLMFPVDRTWLISALWDDDWWCRGGSAALVDTFLQDPGLEVASSIWRVTQRRLDTSPAERCPRRRSRLRRSR